MRRPWLVPAAWLLAVLMVGPAPVSLAEEPQPPAAVAEWKAKDGLQRALMQPEFRAADKLRTDLNTLKLPGLRVELVASAGIRPTRLLLVGTAEAVRLGRAHLARFDVSPGLVSVSVLITEVRLHGTTARGASLLYDKDGVGDPKGTLFRSFATGFDPDRFLVSTLVGAVPTGGSSVRLGDPNVLGGLWESALRMLLERGEADFLAWPNVLCSEGRPAEIQAIENVPHLRLDSAGTSFSVRLVTDPVGLRLKVTPVRVGRDQAVLDIDLWLSTPEVPRGNASFIGDLVLNERKVRTRVTTYDDEPVLFGGLFLRRRLRYVKGLPRLQGLSLVDSLLSADDTDCVDTELVFMVRARVQTPKR